ncbi:MAG: alanine dehydrogenase [Anaerolineae bacterium]|nr:alanine dehydrogenase [Caldilineales bacterium]MCX7852264.1 alanine dehydrogenase [Caldilineales bacterium]MDW8267701.1 alanine dehydrogenase [Anaerolineae bacterium]
MDISLPRERRPDEYRVPLTPAGVATLTKAGHRVFIEHNAGQGAGFSDDEYRKAGATVVYSQAEAYARGEMVVKVARPTVEDLEHLHEEQILTGFLHLAAGRRDKIEILRSRRVCAIAWETVERRDGCLPVLQSISSIAGRLMPQIVGRYLQSNEGGRGVLLSGTPTVPPAEVVILGAGTFGTEAALALAANQASVYVLDISADALIRAHHRLRGRGVTMAFTEYNLRKVVGFADAIIGAVYVPGQRTPVILTREHLRLMRPRSLFVDASIDQGGCAETSRPTTHSNPTYVEEGVVHYCVPNITSIVGRTASHALSYAITPYLLAIADQGLDAALQAYPELERGINICNGEIVHPGLARALQGEASV